jgi:hypothetical protein
MLDVAGCPLWLSRWRCPVLKGWGRDLEEMSTHLANPSLAAWLDPTTHWGIKAEDVQERIEELESDDIG